MVGVGEVGRRADIEPGTGLDGSVREPLQYAEWFDDDFSLAARDVERDRPAR